MSRKAGAADPAITRDTAENLANAGRLKQIRMVAGLIRKSNPKALPIIIGSGLGILAVVVVVGLLTGLAPFLIPLGVLLGLLAALILFGRFAQAAQYSAIEGQPGAAAAVLQNMRGNWTVTPAVSANRNMDVVHRAVGRPGVILVGEGSPNRLASLLAAEKKRVARVAYEVPIFEFQVGDGEGQIPVSKLQRKVMRLPRQLKPAAVSDINHRLKALAVAAGAEGADPEEHQAAQDAQAEGPLSRRVRSAAAYTRMTTVSDARSCRPRRSRSVSSGGIAVSRIAVRTSAQRNPTRSPLVRIVLMPTSRFPTVNPVVAVST